MHLFIPAKCVSRQNRSIKYAYLIVTVRYIVVLLRVATLKNAEEKLQDDLYEMSKPLARYADDEDLERMLKAREREGDPMLKFIKKKPKLTPTGKPRKGNLGCILAADYVIK